MFRERAHDGPDLSLEMEMPSGNSQEVAPQKEFITRRSPVDEAIIP
jgi:hypothetical protein